MEPIAREIFRLFLTNPRKEFSYREIERSTGYSIGTVSKYLKKLDKEGFVISRNTGNTILVKANTENEVFLNMKRVHNIEILYLSGLIRYINEKQRPDAVILFGSYSRGEDIEESDIDIALINSRHEDMDLTRFENTLERKINITYIKSLKNTDKDFLNSLANGIVMYGFVEYW